MEARKYHSPLIQEIMDRTPKWQRMKIHISMTVAANLDDILKNRKISRTEFSRKVEVEYRTVQHWLSGGVNFTIETLCRIADALEISVQELITYKK